MAGKPGYGKTVLSTNIIEDLQGKVSSSGNPHLSTAFFHFSASLGLGYTRSIDAIRAIAVQLIHTHSENMAATECLAMLFTGTNSGQPRASAADIDAVLKLLLFHFPTYLIIDGVDECDDATTFLETLREVSCTSDTRVIILSRPNLVIPSLLFRDLDAGWKLLLTNKHNGHAILSFLVSEFTSMELEGLFGTRHRMAASDRTFETASRDNARPYRYVRTPSPPDRDSTSAPGNLSERFNEPHAMRSRLRESDVEGSVVSPSAIEKLATRANGMFLWVRLLTNLLRCPGLSPRDRLLILEEANLFDGLEGFYSGILSLIGRKSPSRERITTAKIFKWIFGSLYPLSAPTLHTALAIDPGYATADDQYLVNYPDCIARITFALVEIGADGNLGFIHLSFKEYLQSSASSDFPEFTLRNQSAVHAELATICLSYITNDVRQRPLQSIVRPVSIEDELSGRKSGPNLTDPQVTEARRSQVSRTYPLLRYATICWPEHLRLCLDHRRPQGESPALGRSSITPARESEAVPTPSISILNLSSWPAALSQFLTDRISVTIWVEASFLYQLAPKISGILPPVRSLRKQVKPVTMEGREVWWMAMGLEQLSLALDQLRLPYIEKLRDNPTLIWQEDYERVTDPHFWPTWSIYHETARSKSDQKAESGAGAFLPERPLHQPTSRQADVAGVS